MRCDAHDAIYNLKRNEDRGGGVDTSVGPEKAQVSARSFDDGGPQERRDQGIPNSSGACLCV